MDKPTARWEEWNSNNLQLYHWVLTDWPDLTSKTDRWAFVQFGTICTLHFDICTLIQFYSPNQARKVPCYMQHLLVKRELKNNIIEVHRQMEHTDISYSSQLGWKALRPLPLELVLSMTCNCTWGVRYAFPHTQKFASNVSQNWKASSGPLEFPHRWRSL